MEKENNDFKLVAWTFLAYMLISIILFAYLEFRFEIMKDKVNVIEEKINIMNLINTYNYEHSKIK